MRIRRQHTPSGEYATELTEFELCLFCATLRGDTPFGRQGCRCQPGHQPARGDKAE